MMSYSSLVATRFCDLIADARLGSFQGDEFYIVKQTVGKYGTGSRYGFGTTGYGSCSYCDSEEDAWENGDKLNSLANSLYEGLRWFDNVEELITFIKEIDPANEWYANEEDWPKVAKKFVEALLGE